MNNDSTTPSNAAQPVIDLLPGFFIVAGVEADGRLRLTQYDNDLERRLDGDGNVIAPIAGVYRITLSVRFASPRKGAGVAMLLNGKRSGSVLAASDGGIVLTGEVLNPSAGIGFALFGDSHELADTMPAEIRRKYPGFPTCLGHASVTFVGVGCGAPN
jgi:hypothetical protein